MNDSESMRLEDAVRLHLCPEGGTHSFGAKRDVDEEGFTEYVTVCKKCGMIINDDGSNEDPADWQ